MLNIDLKVGDTVLAGKFQNKKVVVTSLETNEMGQPTYNGGKTLLRVRIQKLMKESVGLKAKILKEWQE